MGKEKPLEEKLFELKNGKFLGKILLTSDVHGDVENLEKALEEGAKYGAEITLDLGDLEMEENTYKEMAKKKGFKATYFLPLIQEEDIISKPEKGYWTFKVRDINDFLLNKGKVLRCHFISVTHDEGEAEKAVIGINSNPQTSPPYAYESENLSGFPEIQKFIQNNEDYPLIILRGHDHRQYMANVPKGERLFNVFEKAKIPKLEVITRNENIKTYELRIAEDGEKHKIEQPGLYIINPGMTGILGDFALFELLGEDKYKIEFKKTK